MRRLALAAGAFIASAVADGADLAPLASGDSITGFGVYTGQRDGALTYSKIGEVTYRLSIDANGNRHYLDRNGSAYWIYDREFVRVLFQGRELPPEQFVAFLPPGGKVAPGLKWDVPVHQTRAVCGFAEARFKASSEKGSDLTIDVNGKATNVPTVRITYEAPLRCGERPAFLRTMELVFSPELYEILQSNTVNYDGLERGPLQLGDQGRGWRVLAITTGGK